MTLWIPKLLARFLTGSLLPPWRGGEVDKGDMALTPLTDLGPTVPVPREAGLLSRTWSRKSRPSLNVFHDPHVDV